MNVYLIKLLNNLLFNFTQQICSSRVAKSATNVVKWFHIYGKFKWIPNIKKILSSSKYRRRKWILDGKTTNQILHHFLRSGVRYGAWEHFTAGPSLSTTTPGRSNSSYSVVYHEHFLVVCVSGMQQSRVLRGHLMTFCAWT